jgi:hypothetical protein
MFGEEREQLADLRLVRTAAVLADFEGLGVFDRGALFRAVPLGQRVSEPVSRVGLAGFAALGHPRAASHRIVRMPIDQRLFAAVGATLVDLRDQGVCGSDFAGVFGYDILPAMRRHLPLVRQVPVFLPPATVKDSHP